VLAELGRLTMEERQHPAEDSAPVATPAVTAASSSRVKIALFRSLFRGREDVFPRRWENIRSGKSGYAPVCRTVNGRLLSAKADIRLIRIPAAFCGSQCFGNLTPVR